MPIHRELLNGGVVQTRHPTLLRPGELQSATDCLLRPGDPALHRAPGRTAYGTVAAASVSCTTNGTTALTSAAAFGTAVASISWVEDGLVLTAATGAFSGVSVGQSAWHASIPSDTYVTRVYNDGSNDKIDLSQPATAAGTTQTVTFSDYSIYTRITGSGIPTDTLIASITNASALTMSQAATNSTTASRTFSEAVRGLRTLVFDQYDNLLVAQAGGKLYYSKITGTTGTFATLLSGLSHDLDAALDVIQTKNRHVLLNGIDAPRVVRYAADTADPTIVTPSVRTLGALPVLSANFIGPSLISGSWSSLNAYKEGWYYFIATEVINAGGDDEVEGTYIGDPIGVQLTDHTTQGIRVTLKDSAAAAVNDGIDGRNTATHWRIYMAKQNEGQFPIPDLAEFTRVATVSIGTAYKDITVNNPKQFGWARTYATIASKATLFPDGSTNALASVDVQTRACTYTAGSATITSAALFGTVAAGMQIVSADDDFPYGTYVVSKADSSTITVSTVATAGSGATTKNLVFGDNSAFNNAGARVPIPGGSAATDIRKGQFSDFGIQNIGDFATAAITGIEVEVRAKLQSGSVGAAICQISTEKVGTAESAVTTFIVANPDAWQVFKFGGPDVTWGLSWSPSDFTDAANIFAVNLEANVQGFPGIYLFVDGIKATIYAGSADLDADPVPFATIVIADQLGDAFGAGANGPPPTASTGDIFEGQLLLNDVNDSSVIAASLPDEEESFPDAYRLPLESKDRDQITVIRRLNNACIIGCETSIKRLNYFPTESDADYRRGRAYEDLATDHGMVGPRAAVTFDWPGRGSLLAYLSHNGLHVTDGVTTHILNEDLDWQSLFRNVNIDRTVLEVYPRLYLLALYYEAAGSTNDKKQKALYFSYHPSHVKESGRLPATGPVSVEGESATTTILSGVSYLLTGHSTDGKVYLEDQGTTSADGLDITPTIKSRRFWLRDMGFAGRLERVLLLTDADGNSTTGGFSVQKHVTTQGAASAAEGSAQTADTATGELVEVWDDAFADALDFTISKSAAQTADFRCHYFGFEYIPAEQETN